MITNILIGSFIIIGFILIILDQFFSLQLIDHAAAIGFLFCISGVLILSFKTVKNANKVEKKYYDNYSIGASTVGPEPKMDGGKQYHGSTSNDVNAGDFSSGGGGDGGG